MIVVRTTSAVELCCVSVRLFAPPPVVCWCLFTESSSWHTQKPSAYCHLMYVEHFCTSCMHAPMHACMMWTSPSSSSSSAPLLRQWLQKNTSSWSYGNSTRAAGWRPQRSKLPRSRRFPPARSTKSPAKQKLGRDLSNKCAGLTRVCSYCSVGCSEPSPAMAVRCPESRWRNSICGGKRRARRLQRRAGTGNCGRADPHSRHFIASMSQKDTAGERRDLAAACVDGPSHQEPPITAGTPASIQVLLGLPSPPNTLTLCTLSSVFWFDPLF